MPYFPFRAGQKVAVGPPGQEAETLLQNRLAELKISAEDGKIDPPQFSKILNESEDLLAKIKSKNTDQPTLLNLAAKTVIGNTNSKDNAINCLDKK